MQNKIIITLKIEIKHEEICCAICNQPILKKQKVSIDHWIPKKLGGQDELSNLRPAHKICNSIKADMSPETYMEHKKELYKIALEKWHLNFEDKTIVSNALHAMTHKKRR